MILEGNKKGKGTANFSKYHLSREDFYFYHHNNFRFAVNCTPDEDLEADLEAIAGDCKLDVTKNLAKNMRQLKANITKMCAYKAALEGIVCKKVTVIGFLVDYKSRHATKFTKMEFDLIQRLTTETLCEVGNVQDLQLEDAFVRCTQYLNKQHKLK